MAEESEFYGIVIIGKMNPSIHHPAWYRMFDLIDEKEADAATSSKETFSTPPVAQIDAGTFKIICQESRWEVQTSTPSLLERLKRMPGKVFDELLEHTSVAALGFNINFVKATTCKHVDKYLAGCITSADLGLPNDNLHSGELVLRRLVDDYRVTVRISSSDEHLVTVSSNYEYRFQSQKKMESFKLGEIVSKRFAEDRSDAEAHTASIVDAINKASES